MLVGPFRLINWFIKTVMVFTICFHFTSTGETTVAIYLISRYQKLYAFLSHDVEA